MTTRDHVSGESGGRDGTDANIPSAALRTDSTERDGRCPSGAFKTRARG